MFFYGGKKNGRIKTYHEYGHSCKQCRAFDIEVKVYEDYFQVYYIPVFPIGNKHVEMRCNTCGSPFRLYELEKNYERQARAPFYFYSFTILFLSLVVLITARLLYNQHIYDARIESPERSDVYLIERNGLNGKAYYFLKVVDIKNDSLLCFINAATYHKQIYSLASNDYFISADTLKYSLSEIKSMYGSNTLLTVSRGYDNESGFNIIR